MAFQPQNTLLLTLAPFVFSCQRRSCCDLKLKNRSSRCLESGWKLSLARKDIGQPLEDFLEGPAGGQYINHLGDRGGPDLVEVNFLMALWVKSKLLDGRGEAGIDPVFVAARIGPVPADVGEIYGIQAVQAETGPRIILPQALVTKTCGDAVGAQQGGQQVALGVAETRTGGEDL